MSSIYNTQVDNAKDVDLVMPMYKLVEYSDDHSETSESLWQYYRDEPGLLMLLIIFLVIVLRLNLNKK